MSSLPTAYTVKKADPQSMKLWAAEDLAISMGLLRECPYHGQPFKSHDSRVSAGASFPDGLIDPLDPLVQVFAGNTRELMDCVEQVTGGYGERCPHCAAMDHEEFDD